LREQRGNSETGKAIDNSFKRREALTRFLDDGRICMSNNAAERKLRAIAVGHRNWTFAGSDEGDRRAARHLHATSTAKLNNVDPPAWLADVLARLPDQSAKLTPQVRPHRWASPIKLMASFSLHLRR
jgi:transposase